MTHAMRARLQAYAEHALTQWTAPVVGPLGRITDGWESELYTLDVEHGPAGARQRMGLVLRLYPGEGAAGKAEHEFYGMRGLYEAGYPVPWVHHLALADSPVGQPFILMARIAGEPLWPGLTARPPAEQQALLTQFSELFVRLHRLDWRPFAVEPEKVAHGGPWLFVDQALAVARDAVSRRFGLPGFLPVVDWLAARREAAACARPAVVHRDFHPANVLLRADGSAVVIDWSGLGVTDARFDLAWTLMLARSHVSADLSKELLWGYERASGETVAELAYFQVFACLRRLVEVTVSLTRGAAHMGMRPEAAALMQAQLPVVAAVHRWLEALTGVRVPEVEKLLG